MSTEEVLRNSRCEMAIYGAVVATLLLRFVVGQDANCDFSQNVQVGQTYYINYRYPASAARQCRWIGVCPAGYRCSLNCPEINLPSSSGCSVDRLLISRSGDPQLNNADVYCGRGSTSVVSTGQRISIGLITSSRTTGGNFQCELRAQADSPTPTCSCGYKKTNRIVGGQETGINEFPPMAGIVYVDQREIRCGGTIIDKRYVITAAHCVTTQPTSNLAVVVGEHDVTTGDSPATAAYNVASVVIHPQYKESTYDYDIAILRVSNDMVFSDRVGPACMPFKFANTDFTGKTFTLLGWGTLGVGMPKPNTLQKVDVTVISQSSCQQRVPALTQRQICTYTSGKDACQEDSGGPALYTDPATGLLFIAGIISYGRSCAEAGQPGINTRVPVVQQWIQNNTPGAQYCNK